MSKPFPYWFRLSIVSSLSVLLSFNPAFAGRIMHRALCGNGYQVSANYVSSCDGCMPTPSIPCGCDVPSGSSVVVESSCGGGCGAVDASVSTSAISTPGCGCGVSGIDSSVVPNSDMGHIHDAEPMPSAPAQSLAPAGEASPMPSIVPKINMKSIDSEPPMPKTPSVPEPKNEPKTEPAKPATDDLFTPATPAAVEPLSPIPAPKDDLFSTPSISEPAMKPVSPTAEDLFSSPPSNEPATKPVTPADDLFSAPPPTPPTTKPADAAAPADDLFAPQPLTPSSTPAAPAAPPALDDLFGPTPTEKAPTPPAGNSDLDNLFKSTSAEPPSNLPTDIAKPVSKDSESDPNFDDLFANPAAMSKDESRKPTDQNSIQQSPNQSEADMKRPANNNFDDLFKSTSAPKESTFRGAEFRAWVDNTGDYSVNARLAVIYPDRVRLIKENGKFTSVPISRLSEVDRDYVNWVAVNLSQGPTTKFVNTETNPASLLQDMAR